MGRHTGREDACFSIRDLTHFKPTIPYQDREKPPLHPRLNAPRFPVVYLPPEHAVYLEDEFPGMFFPMCTWGTCPDTHGFMTPNGLIRGTMLMTTALTEERDAQDILLYHLEHSHRLKNVVEPFEPYGLIIVKLPHLVWNSLL